MKTQTCCMEKKAAPFLSFVTCVNPSVNIDGINAPGPAELPQILDTKILFSPKHEDEGPSRNLDLGGGGQGTKIK